MGIAEQIEKLEHAMSVADVSKVLQLHSKTIRRQMRSNGLPYFKVGKTVRFDPKSIATWLRKQSV